MAVLTPPACSFSWTIRNHPVFDECSDQWCDTHNAWRREQPPRDVCEAVTAVVESQPDPVTGVPAPSLLTGSGR